MLPDELLKKKMMTRVGFTLLLWTLLGCNDGQKFDSQIYFREENKAFNEVIAGLINTKYSTGNFSDPDSAQLFFLFDSLKEVINVDGKYLAGNLERRAISDCKFLEFPGAKLRLVRRYPDEKRIREHDDTSASGHVSISKRRIFHWGLVNSFKDML